MNKKRYPRFTCFQIRTHWHWL